VSSPTSIDLLRGLYRIQAFERAAGREPHPHEMVAPAALALSLRGGRHPDVLTLRSGAASAALLRGLGARELARYQAGAPPRGRSEHDVPGLGRSGYAHPTFHSLGLLAPVPPPGTSVTVSAGVALAAGLLGQPRLSVLVESGSSAASGMWHEGFNLAAARRAPLVLVLLHDEADVRRPSIARRGQAYGVRAEQVPADSAGRLARRLGEILDEAREEPGTWLVEVEPLRGSAITELEARLVEGGGNRARVELDELTTWSDAAEQEAAEAWAGLAGATGGAAA